MTQSSLSSSLDHLTRLAAKPGVRATLILSKADGAIIRSTGMFSDVPSTDYSASETPASSDGPVTVEQSQQVEGKGFNAQDMAKKVFRFVAAAEELANGVRDSEEVKLLRLRTKNHEMVIVPDVIYLLVVMHDAP
ncbi:hypothetical protein MMC09_001965 [Bachmanniomyces sp. S44760]|nr:hypothetical protein [Bachmanniomyces sp. S44760]